MKHRASIKFGIAYSRHDDGSGHDMCNGEIDCLYLKRNALGLVDVCDFFGPLATTRAPMLRLYRHPECIDAEE